METAKVGQNLSNTAEKFFFALPRFFRRIHLDVYVSWKNCFWHLHVKGRSKICSVGVESVVVSFFFVCVSLPR